MNIKNKGQEEMVGFALIVIIVAVILLVFLSFYLRSDSNAEPVESYEVGSFIQSVLQYTTQYESEEISIRKLIKQCDNYDKGCDILEKELEGIMDESWAVEDGGVVKGYSLNIVSKDKEILELKKGIETENYKSSLPTSVDNTEITIKIFY